MPLSIDEICSLHLVSRVDQDTVEKIELVTPKEEKRGYPSRGHRRRRISWKVRRDKSICHNHERWTVKCERRSTKSWWNLDQSRVVTCVCKHRPVQSSPGHHSGDKNGTCQLQADRTHAGFREKSENYCSVLPIRRESVLKIVFFVTVRSVSYLCTFVQGEVNASRLPNQTREIRIRNTNKSGSDVYGQLGFSKGITCRRPAHQYIFNPAPLYLNCNSPVVS